MATAVTWDVDAIVSLMTTQLDSIANGSGSGLGVEFDNGATQWLFGDFELVLGTMTAATANAPVDLYMVTAPDGTNYGQGGTTAQPPNFYKGSYVLLNTTTSRLTIQGIPLPPCKFKTFLVNRSGQAFGTGNTLKMLPYGYLIT
jgi:hypothetical protein